MTSPHVPRTREGNATLFSTALTALGRSFKGRAGDPFKVRANGLSTRQTSFRNAGRKRLQD